MVRVEHQIAPCHACRYFAAAGRPLATAPCLRPELKAFNLVVAGLSSCNLHEPRRA
jgi:hypothetical protein